MARGKWRLRSGMTAAELVAEIERMKREDPAYRAKVEAVEAEQSAHEERLRLAEQPIASDLRERGFDIESAWDLVGRTEPYPLAFPVLLEHLRRGGYPDRIMEGLGRALAVPPAVEFWDDLRELYLQAKGPGEEEGLAVALAATASSEHFDDLTRLLREDSRGSSRVHFLSAIQRVDGARGRKLLWSLKFDSMFGREARALLRRRG